MDGRIVINEGKQRVGSVAWNGTMSSGSWVFLVNPQIDSEARRKDIRDRVGFAYDSNQGLEEEYFRGPRGVYYRGWHGFIGVINALRRSLPAVGLWVDWNRTEWLNGPVRSSFPIDVDDKSRVRQEEEYELEARAIEQWEYLAFIERNPELEKQLFDNTDKGGHS